MLKLDHLHHSRRLRLIEATSEKLFAWGSASISGVVGEHFVFLSHFNSWMTLSMSRNKAPETMAVGTSGLGILFSHELVVGSVDEKDWPKVGG